LSGLRIDIIDVLKTKLESFPPAGKPVDKVSSLFSDEFDSRDLARANTNLTGDLHAILDTCFAIYDEIPSAMGNLRMPMLVYRFPNGWHTCSPDVRGLGLVEPLSTEELQERIGKLVRVVGPEPKDLAVLPLVSYDFPTFDRRWLPDLQAVIRHLPRFRLQAERTKDGLKVREQGIALIICAYFIPLAVPFVHSGEDVVNRVKVRQIDRPKPPTVSIQRDQYDEPETTNAPAGADDF
jgi:hypothetical protein